VELEFLEELTTILGAALVVAGLLIGSHLLGLAGLGWVDPQGFALIAGFGVVFLLFSLGLEFSLPRMLSFNGPRFRPRRRTRIRDHLHIRVHSLPMGYDCRSRPLLLLERSRYGLPQSWRERWLYRSNSTLDMPNWR